MSQYEYKLVPLCGDKQGVQTSVFEKLLNALGDQGFRLVAIRQGIEDGGGLFHYPLAIMERPVAVVEAAVPPNFSILDEAPQDT